MLSYGHQSSNDSRSKPMPLEQQRQVEEEAREYYLNKMDDYVSSNYQELCNNMLEVRQKHVEFRFEAVDILRKKSVQMANTWKLERDINEKYGQYLARLRKRHSFSS